jgi:MYXO-CTERM domain-containing protein
VRLSRLVIASAALTLSVGSAHGASKDVPYSTTPIQLSGDISQFPQTSKLFDLSGQSSDNTASFYAVWDDQALYFGVQVQDTALYCSALTADSETAWANDGIELNFDLLSKKQLPTLGDQDFRQWIFPANFNNNAYDAYGTGSFSDVSFSGTAQVNVKLNGTLNDSTADTGYTMIIKIPWADLAQTPANDFSFGFDGAVNDRDSLTETITYMDWANLTVFAQADQWNDLRLTGQTVVPKLDTGVNPPTDSYNPATDGWIPPQGDSGGTTTPPRPKDEFSCDCRLGAGGGSPWPALLLGLAVLIGLMRRRL